MKRVIWPVLLALTVLVVAACSSDTQNSEPVTLAISYPEEGQILLNDRIRVRGTATNTATVTVNDTLADVVGGEWEVLVPFEQGDVTATAVAGGKLASVNFVVDSHAPLLELTSPERGLYTTEDTVTIRGRVTEDGVGLQYVEIGGQELEVQADGTFAVDWPLNPGYNTLAVRARDRAGNESEALRGVITGPTIGPTETIDPAFQMFVRQEAVDTVESVVESFVSPEFVTSFVKENFMYEFVTVDTITFDPIDVELVPRMGRIDLELNATNVDITGSFTIGEDTFPTTITVRKFAVLVEMSMQPAADGSIDFSFGQATLEMADEDLEFTIQDLTQDDVQFLRDLIVEVARTAFGELLSETIFDSLFDPEILKRRIEILGRTLVFELRFEEIRVFPDGIFIRLSMQLPEERFPDVRDVPGALNIPPDNPNGPNSENDILFTSTRNALDRILHGVWRSGLLHQELRGSDFGGFELPVELTSGALAIVLDNRINDLVPSGTPAGIRLRPLFPPVIELGAEGTIGVKLGELLVDVVLFPTSGDEVKVATVANFLELTIALGVDGVVVTLDFDTEIQSDLAEEPAFDLDDEAVEDLIESVVALVPEILEQSLDIRGEADITWVRLQNPMIEIHGVATDHLSVSLSMVPNPDGFSIE